jgi:DNA-binding XRE family transcriptional regulator
MSDLIASKVVQKGARLAASLAQNIDQDPCANDWNYSSGIRIFHFGDGQPPPLTATGFLPMPHDRQLAGCVCQAARALLDVTQAWLWQNAKVSRKTINDFENGYARPKAALNLRIRRALERAGAQFVYGENVVGVIVYKANPASGEPSDQSAQEVSVNHN